MTFNFDQVINRRETKSSKWDYLKKRFGRDDVLAMWVADMDFLSPPSVQTTLVNRAHHGMYGYGVHERTFDEAIVRWMKTRHKWDIQPEWIRTATGVVPALNVIVQEFSKEGDGVLIQPPVYHPFKRVIENWGRRVLENPLVEKNGKYHMDFADLEEQAKDAKIMFLCSPHNPIGRVWTVEELKRVGEICTRHNVLVVADEIHHDLVYHGYHHTPFASISDDFSMNSITCAAPSKTFNLAGLNTAYIIAKNPDFAERYERHAGRMSLGGVNVFGVEATITAYDEGHAWLDELMVYLGDNLKLVTEYIAEHIPEIRVIQPEATYLVWLDCRALGLAKEELDKFMIDEARLALNEGHLFGDVGTGFQRMNIACPRTVIEQALTQLHEAVKRVIRA